VPSVPRLFILCIFELGKLCSVLIRSSVTPLEYTSTTIVPPSTILDVVKPLVTNEYCPNTAYSLCYYLFRVDEWCDSAHSLLLPIRVKNLQYLLLNQSSIQLQ